MDALDSSATPRARFLSRAGLAGIAGGLAVVVQLSTHGAGSGVAAALGMAASVAVLAGLRSAGACGTSPWGCRALDTWLVSYGLLVATSLLSRLAALGGGTPVSLLLYLISLPALLLLFLAAPVAGAASARADALPGWRRWAVPGLALGELIGILPWLGVGVPGLILLFPAALIAAGTALVTLARTASTATSSPLPLS